MENIRVKVPLIISFLLLFIYSYLFFSSILISTIISIILSLAFKPIISNFFESKDKKLKRIMFREFLDIFNSNIISGLNFFSALKMSSIEINHLFTDKKYIIIFLEDMIKDIDNGKSMEEALIKFKERSRLEEIDIFVDSMVIALKSGIDISRITSNSKEMLTSSISLELELATISENSKRDFIIMSFLPLIILILLNITSARSLNIIDYIIRVPVFVLFIFSFYLGHKIVNLEI